MTAGLLLYEHPLSSYAQKVKIALREKGFAFDLRTPESFGTRLRDDAFARASPRHEVPCLMADGQAIFDSTVICEYLEDIRPAPALLPQGALARAKARMIEDICDTQYEAINWGWGEILWFGRATGDLAVRMRAVAAAHTTTMQAWLENGLGDAPWFGGDAFGGDAFGWADMAAAPVVNRSVHYGLGPPPGSLLAAWHERVRARPAVRQTFAEFDAAAARMVAAAGLYASGERRREYRDHRLDWMIRAGGLAIVEAGMAADNIRFSWPGD